MELCVIFAEDMLRCVILCCVPESAKNTLSAASPNLSSRIPFHFVHSFHSFIPFIQFEFVAKGKRGGQKKDKRVAREIEFDESFVGEEKLKESFF